MAKTNTLLKKTTNCFLDYLEQIAPDTLLPSESELARLMDVSRTTIHGVLSHLEQNQLLKRAGSRMILRRAPQQSDRFADTQTVGTQERIERLLMERMLRGGWQAGYEFSEADLARESGVSTASVREFLINFSHYQLIEKRSRSGWRLLGLNADFVNEVADMRDLVEMTAIRAVSTDDHTDRQAQLQNLLTRHLTLEANLDSQYLDFPALDYDFHSFLISQMKNRFAIRYLDVVCFVFHYHYRWNKEGQKARVSSSLKEHIAILNSLLAGETERATKMLKTHLTTARISLLEVLDSSAE